MALILCMDTATKACSVALCSNGEVLSERNLIEEGYVHAEKLHVLVSEVLIESGKNLNELDAIAAGSGPGSYTGLRIGISTAKGFCYGSNIPLIGIPTLQIMAAAAKEKINSSEFTLRPLIDARRMEVYSTAYGPELDELDPCKAIIMDDSSFSSELDQGPVYFFGDGMEKCRTLLSSHSNARFIAEIFPRASAMGWIAELRFSKNEVEDVAYFEPFYLKEFQAKKSRPML